VARYQSMYPDTRMRVPGNVFYNGYMATRSLLEAVERAGTTNNHAVIKELEQLKVSAEDRLQHFDAQMNPKTHQMQQTIYLATANSGTEDEDAMFKILSWSEPGEVSDEAADESCQLESLDDTPVYEP
jgi:branched-chain amino acid transport system substrate-binding protein